MGRWSEFHDQRKGQWLVNYIRFNLGRRGQDLQRYLFNMTNEELEYILKKYYESNSIETWIPKKTIWTETPLSAFCFSCIADKHDECDGCGCFCKGAAKDD